MFPRSGDCSCKYYSICPRAVAQLQGHNRYKEEGNRGDVSHAGIDEEVLAKDPVELGAYGVSHFFVPFGSRGYIQVRSDAIGVEVFSDDS